MSYWIKLYVEILNDPKIGRLPDNIKWRFTEALLLAGSEDKNGLLPNIADAAYMAHITEDQLTKDWRTLEGVGLLVETPNGWMVTNFAKRQAPSDVTERVKLHRERKMFLQRYSNISVTTPESDTDTETYTDTELREDSAPRDAFRRVQVWIETATGMPVAPKDVDALRELASMTDLIEQDVIGAVAWHRDQGRVVHGASQLLGSIKYNRGKRIQASAKPSTNGSKPRKNTGVIQAAIDDLDRREGKHERT